MIPRPPAWFAATLAASLLALLWVLPAVGLGADLIRGPSTDLGPGTRPQAITAGPDGAMWFTVSGASRVGRLTVDGIFTEYRVGGGDTGEVTAITTGPDGGLWFLHSSRGLIGRMDPVTKVVTEFSAGSARCARICDITTGPDGAMWFTDSAGDRLGRITTGGVVTEFRGRGTGPEMITAGSDGRLWFTCGDGFAVCRLAATGAVRVLSVPFDREVGRISSITTGPDGNVWVADQVRALWRITPDGVLTAFPVRGPGSPNAVAAGPDGNLWFTYSEDLSRGWVGSMTPRGEVRFLRPVGQPGYSLPQYDIAPGVDGGVWFTDSGWIGRISPDGLVGTYPPTPVVRGARQQARDPVILARVECPPASPGPCSGGIGITAVGPRGLFRAGEAAFTVPPSAMPAEVPVEIVPQAQRLLASQGYLGVTAFGFGPRGGLGWRQDLALRRRGGTVPRPVRIRFRSPTGNLACGISDDLWGGIVRCRSIDEPASVVMRWTGEVRACPALSCARGLSAPRRVAPYGSAVRTPHFTCQMRRDGVRCAHTASGHGFRINATRVQIR